MQTHLAPEFQGTPDGQAAEAILRKCVHCGFCTATCPTYQLLGDELDGPRGRIYLMKKVLEGAQPTRATQQHLDRCLSCRNCETTCPSGVQYGALVEIGRRVVDAKVPRPAGERAVRWLLKEGLPSPLFGTAMALGRALRPLVPAGLRDKVPAAAHPRARQWPQRTHPRKVLMLMGCVQPAMLPNINAATARVLDAAGIQTLVAEEAGCCGAIRAHLGDQPGGLADMRRNIDAWWPQVAQGQVEAIVMNASGCGAMVKDYGHALAGDPDYADKAARISALMRAASCCPTSSPRSSRGCACHRAACWPSTRPARCSMRSACAAASRPGCVNWASMCGCPPNRTCAAAPPAPTACCSPNSAPSCASASWASWARCSRRPSSRPTSAASSTCRPAPARRCGTGWRRWTRRWTRTRRSDPPGRGSAPGGRLPGAPLPWIPHKTGGDPG